MTKSHKNNLAAQWTHAGALFNVSPAHRSPDLERLLLETARQCPGNTRLFTQAVNWLTRWGSLVARHRLRRLVVEELDFHAQPVLGLLIDAAVELGAPRELRTASELCTPATPARPLFDAYARNPLLQQVAESTASSLSRAWGLWAPPAEVKTDALRPLAWVVANNPIYRSRSQYKGDLRCSIIETLRYDVEGGVVDSESALARLCAASRPAIHAALHQLEIEGRIVVATKQPNSRKHAISLAA